MSELNFTLEKWTEKFIPDLIEHADNPRVAKNLRNIFPNPYTEANARFWIDICESADEDKNYNRAIVIDGEAVGGIGLIFGEDVYCRSAEIGYWLGEDFRGQGLMPRAVKEICTYCFTNHDTVRIFAGVFARNTASRRVLEKSGFVLEGVHRKSIYKNGEFDDSCMYSLIKD